MSRRRHYSNAKRLLYSSGCHDKPNYSRWDFYLGPVTLQPGMLSLDHCDSLCSVRWSMQIKQNNNEWLHK